MANLFFRPNPSLRQAVGCCLVVVSFLVLDAHDWTLWRWMGGQGEGPWIALARAGLFRFAAQIVAVMAVTALVLRFLNQASHDPLSALGLGGGAQRGIGVSAAVCLLLPITFLLADAQPSVPVLLPHLIRYSVFSGVTEEIFYRGFLFGLLYRFCAVRFAVAALVVAVLFGVAHIHQGESIGDAASVFLITAVGSLWFAWLYVQWDFNLFVPIGFHTFMNGWWEVFDVSANAAGPVLSLAARGAVIAVSIALTLYLRSRYTRRCPL